jgi:TolB-like protein
MAATVLSGCLCLAGYSQAPAEDDPLQTVAKKVAERLLAKKRARVTVLDFTDLQNRPNELGRYLGLRLADELVNLTEATVLDRANIATIMAEHKLTMEGLLKPEDAKKLGQFAGVDALLIGNLSLIGENVEILIRAISTETSEILASGHARIPATDELRRMLGQAVDSKTKSAGASAAEGPVIAMREIGPIKVVLRNVAEHSMVMGDRYARRITVPAIQCTFELENRSLQSQVAVAANQRVSSKTTAHRVDGYRGDLHDSNRRAWSLIEVKGISAVNCFETAGHGAVSQRNPGGIVEYIRTATKYDEQLERETRYWSGSFSSIPPGQKIRMTVDFARASPPDQDRRSGNATDSRPEYFQLDMELVLGTYSEGEDPTKAKDLMLRNLTLDRISLSQKADKSAEVVR